jgi:hypothetical protein
MSVKPTLKSIYENMDLENALKILQDKDVEIEKLKAKARSNDYVRIALNAANEIYLKNLKDKDVEIEKLKDEVIQKSTFSDFVLKESSDALKNAFEMFQSKDVEIAKLKTKLRKKRKK